MGRKLNTRSGLITVILYMIGSIVAGIIASVFFGGLSSSPDETVLDNVIDSSMYANIMISVVLVFVCLYVFKDDTRKIFFEEQPFTRSKLYYVYPLVLVGIIIWALVNVEWASYSLNVIVLVIIATLAIGFNEEVVTRGILLVGFRNGGLKEWQVFLFTTVVFGLLHSVNLLAGANFTQILVTWASGSLFYAARRVSNTLFVPIILHAVYDTGFFLLTGIYAQESGSLPSGVLDIQLGAFLIMLIATVVFVIFGRGIFNLEKPAPA